MCAGQLESENMLTGSCDNVEVIEDSKMLEKEDDIVEGAAKDLDDVEVSLDLHLSPDKSQEEL